MRSNVFVTYEIDDPGLAARTLADGICRGFGFMKNSVGLLFCYSDMELDGMLPALRERLDFDVIGCTCIASMDGADGFHEMCATLIVLTADDCHFSVAISEDVTAENATAQIEQTYARAKEGLDGEPKLLFALPPYKLEVTLDDFTNVFNRVAKGIVTIGGIPSHNASGDVNATIMDGGAFPNRLVLLLVSGNIRPVCTVKKVTGSSIERKRKVTSAEANTVYTVGNQPFADYMTDIGLPIEKLTTGNTTITFVSNPLLLENVEVGGENFSFVRTLHKIDPETGSGTAVGYIPEGATLSICSLQREDIEQAAVLGIRELNEKMRENAGEYRYSTVLAVSCIGRYLLMLPHNDVEVKRILDDLPGDVNLCGFYSYGEIGPVPLKSREVLTFAYNESLVLCAF